MKRSLASSLVLLFSCAFLPSSSAQEGEPGPDGIATASCSGARWEVVHKTTPDCNCSGAPGELQVCHSEEVQVAIGEGTLLTLKTGRTQSSCFAQEVPDGTCLSHEYVFDCCETGWGPWADYVCTLRNTRAVTSSTECD